MILVGETNPNAREVAFHLSLASNPLTGLTGHIFTLGEVRVRVPGMGFVNVALANIIEIGYGDYTVILTPAQVATRGTVYLDAIVSGAQPWSSEETIGGAVAVGQVDAEFPFHLATDGDPLTPITGHVFLAGEVQVFVPGGAYANATLANVVEKGAGDYALLSAGLTAAKGKVFLYAKSPTSQVWTSWVDVVDATTTGGGTGPVIPPPPPVGTNVAAYAGMMLDLLPPGKIWRFVGSKLYKFFLACADELGRLDARTVDVQREAVPATAVELLPDYEDELDLPSTGTTAERQARVVARLVARQGYRPVDVQQALALLLGQAPADVVVLERSSAFAASIGDAREIFRFFVYRDPTLPGAYYVASAQALLDKIEHSHNIGTVIESTAMLYDDAHSLYDRDMLGA